MMIKTNKLSIIQKYLALICKVEILYLPPFYLNHKFLIHIFLGCHPYLCLHDLQEKVAILTMENASTQILSHPEAKM